MLENRIVEKSEEIKDELIKIRRDIHSHPEIALEEKRTSSIVANKLIELGLDVQVNVGVTGVIGLLKGKYEGKTILLRADMDCLKMEELNDVEYKSQYAGQMHACGHDAHTTWLLGAAMILSEMKEEIHGNVKFLFQPAEEGIGGAERMIKAGALENPKVDAAIGAHVWPSIKAGEIGVKYGDMMAAGDMFTLKIKGKGAHGAEPHKSIDPISISVQVYLAFQAILSRRINPIDTAVITVSMFNAGSAHNIIPQTSDIEGTVRTFNEETRDNIIEMMDSSIKGITEANGADYEFYYRKGYPAVVNNDEIVSVVEKAGREILGNNKVVIMNEPTMAAEDFSYFTHKVPSAFFIVGTYNKEKSLVNELHNANFNIDEDILNKASAVMAKCALNYLNN
ncbi:M20 metallopeptidase family protein [Clostridium sp. DL1XJH146]